jgi:hypothetical protein
MVADAAFKGEAGRSVSDVEAKRQKTGEGGSRVRRDDLAVSKEA